MITWNYIDNQLAHQEIYCIDEAAKIIGSLSALNGLKWKHDNIVITFDI